MFECHYTSWKRDSTNSQDLQKWMRDTAVSSASCFVYEYLCYDLFCIIFIMVNCGHLNMTYTSVKGLWQNQCHYFCLLLFREAFFCRHVLRISIRRGNWSSVIVQRLSYLCVELLRLLIPNKFQHAENMVKPQTFEMSVFLQWGQN